MYVCMYCLPIIYVGRRFKSPNSWHTSHQLSRCVPNCDLFSQVMGRSTNNRTYRGNLGDDIGETGISCCVRGQCGSMVLGVGGRDGAIRHKRGLAAV